MMSNIPANYRIARNLCEQFRIEESYPNMMGEPQWIPVFGLGIHESLDTARKMLLHHLEVTTWEPVELDGSGKIVNG